MDGTVQKWGNSLGLRIPKALVEELGVCSGARVKLKMKGKALTVTVVPASAKTVRYDLRDLTAKISAKNKHREIELGAPAGVEQW
jgi:antitoxin MazE